MVEVVENQEKIFEHFLELSPKLRMFIIDKQQPDDRVRFTRCSKMCNKEAKASKNYIFGLGLTYCSDNFAKIQVDHQRCNLEEQEERQGYSLVYCELFGQKVKQYKTPIGTLLESCVLDKSTNLAQYAYKDFEKLMQRYQKNVKSLHFTNTISEMENVDFGVDSLDNLENLGINGNYDIRSIFSKLRRPLKDLTVDGVYNMTILPECEELYQVENYLVAMDLKLDKQQFSRLSSKGVLINIGSLTAKNIFEIVRSWQNGTIGKQFDCYSWFLDGSNFDMKKFAKLLRIGDRYLSMENIEVKHFKEHGKSAALWFHGTAFSFNC